MNKISKTQFEFYKQKHWELWDWLARHPEQHFRLCGGLK